MALVEYGSESDSYSSDDEAPKHELQDDAAPLPVGWIDSNHGSLANSTSITTGAGPESPLPFRLKRKASRDLTPDASRSGTMSSPPLYRLSDPTDEIGPLMGPRLEPAPYSPSPPGSPASEQPSPYSFNRATIHSLTLPMSIPEIPSSPLGEEPHATASKFGHFRDLKGQGIHFNEQLMGSSSMQNPGLSESLPDFVGVSSADQYTTTFPEDLWDPAVFTDKAMRDELMSHYQEVLRKRKTGEIHPVELQEADEEDEEDEEDGDEVDEVEEDEDALLLTEAERLEAKEKIKQGREVIDAAMARVRKVVEEQQSMRVGMKEGTRSRSGSVSSEESGYAKEDKQWDLSWVLAE